MSVRIGYACTPVMLPYRTSRAIVLKNFNEVKFNECTSANLSDLKHILEWNVKNNIYMFRISSDIIPFGSHPVNTLNWQETFKTELKALGNFIIKNNIRVSMHPGQYTILNSINEDVVNNSIADLEYHCNFLDALGVDSSHKLIIHVGGVYGNKPLAISNFISNYAKLSTSIKNRLVLENDDKNYTIEEVLSICNRLNMPAVFDNLHHKLNPCLMGFHDILTEVSKTWSTKDGSVKVHYSDQDYNKKNGSHSKFIDTKNFMSYISLIKDYNMDIMLEVKDKELSALKCINLINDKPSSLKYSIWAKYKYSVMEKNYSCYKLCSKLVNSNASLKDIYEAIDKALELPFNEGNFINTAEHVYGYVKTNVNLKEKEKFFKLLSSPLENSVKLKNHLKKLCKKYNSTYINESYYFIY